MFHLSIGDSPASVRVWGGVRAPTRVATVDAVGVIGVGEPCGIGDGIGGGSGGAAPMCTADDGDPCPSTSTSASLSSDSDGDGASARVWLSAQTPLGGVCATRGRVERVPSPVTCSRGMFACKGFAPIHYDIPLYVFVNYEKRVFLSWCAYGSTVSLYTYALVTACARDMLQHVCGVRAYGIYGASGRANTYPRRVRAFR